MEEKGLKRCNQLYQLGLIFNGDSYVKDDINVHWTEITCSTDKEFNTILSKIKNEITNRKNPK